MSFDIKPYQTKMDGCIAAYENELAGVRSGRASTTAVTGINVDYYGSPTPINQVAEVKLADPMTIAVTPWDKSTLKDVEKAIIAADLGVNPQNDGSMIRIAFQPLTEDKRKEIVKQIKAMGENAKVALRNVRRDANDKAKELKKDSVLTEDGLKDAEKNVQDLTDKYVKKIDELTEKKSKEVMTV
ncbi:MAG: ribosome recycling factor [Oscillospiraceae bacterium]|nr:ribosome recycling factor [Oscillospiraceae bacterium]